MPLRVIESEKHKTADSVKLSAVAAVKGNHRLNLVGVVHNSAGKGRWYMNGFINELVKATLAVIAVVGVVLIAVGVVFLAYPEIMRWAIVLTSIFFGIFLCGCAVYGIIKAKTP